MLRMILSLTLVAAAARAQPGEAQSLRRVVALLDYVAGDYARAVGEHGEVLSQAEHVEQIGFVEDAARELRADVNGRGEDLARRLDALKKQVADRAPPAEVARGARGIRDEIVQRFNVILLPQRAPYPGRGARLYAQACAACHGVDGHPNLALELPTKPPDFRTEAGPLTPQRIFSAATYGVPKTAMPAFDSALTDEERWDVAFYVLSLAHPAASPRGLELARAALLPSRYADLATMSDDDLRARLAAAGLGAGEQEQALAAVRAGPFAEDVQGSPYGLSHARAAVRTAVALARKSDRAGARRTLISAYLDHFEPHEAALRARDAELVQEVEGSFLALRAAIDGRQPDLEARAARLDGLLEKADARGPGGGLVAFVAALAIALREGVEAALLVAGLLALIALVAAFQRLGRKLQPRPLLVTCGVLLCALAVLMVGHGVRSLQVLGALPLTIWGAFQVPALGLYATREGLCAQAFVVVALIASALWTALRRDRRDGPADRQAAAAA